MLRLAPTLLFLFASAAAAEISFNRDIRPIMSDTCFRCHGPDKSSRMMGLRLDLRDEATKPTATGVTPIVPGDPAKSAIIQRVFATNARVMPPKSAHKDLTAKQKETLRQWVAEGAKYEGHWAYQPVRRIAPPSAAQHPVDAFVNDRLAREGLTAAPEADRRTLLRRVTLDLTGLPPAPADLDAFLADKTPGAYERVIDRLIASPAYAEKQAMHWLDAARYADTCGYHGDNPIPAWPFRDWVLGAIRDNMPFDRFTRAQLAGDLLPGATRDDLVASAFNRLTRTSAEGGLQPKEYLAKYAADRVRTVSAVWLGSTLGCAECHDHKFDPFTARDFYSMKAFFADIEETGLVPDRGAKAWGTQLSLPAPEQQTRLDDLAARIKAAREEIDAAPVDEAGLLERYRSGALAWKTQRPVAARSANGATLTIHNTTMVESSRNIGGSNVNGKVPGNGMIVAGGPNPDNETYTVTLRPGAGTWTALGLEVIRDEALAAVYTSRGGDRFLVTEVELLAAGKPAPVVLATTGMTYMDPSMPAMAAIDGDPATGWGLTENSEGRNPFLALRLAEPLKTSAATALTVRIRHDSRYRRATIGRFRLHLSNAAHSWPEAPQARLTPPPKSGPIPYGGIPEQIVKALDLFPAVRSESENAAVAAYVRWADPALTAKQTALAALERERGLLESSIPRIIVTRAVTPADTRVLARGNWMDESGEIVAPAVPAFLGKLGATRATRLDLANWLVSKENPLTARVYVNRVWRQFFGTGLSKSLDDLGSQGEWPTHPELLDWLASEFMTNWDMKHVVRTIVTSETYRRSSLPPPGAAERDPDNRLLARQSRFRVDAEIVHDIALASAGLLTDRFGGPSARPYQPEGYLAALNFPKRDYSESRGDELYRRGIYTHWQRAFLHPSLAAFDAPAREECTLNRTNSNTPLQALVLLNDPIYVEAARVFAQRILADGGATLDARIDFAFTNALSRPPSADERGVLAALYTTQLARFRAAPAEARKLIATGEAPLPASADPPALAAMTTVARAILNLHETITRN